MVDAELGTVRCVGKLHYGAYQRTFDIDDRLLAHLRLVFMNKLRRGEPFMFHHVDANGTTSLWVHPSVSFVFHFYGGRQPAINRVWVEALMQEASGARGLYVMPESDAREESLSDAADLQPL